MKKTAKRKTRAKREPSAEELDQREARARLLRAAAREKEIAHFARAVQALRVKADAELSGLMRWLGMQFGYELVTVQALENLRNDNRELGRQIHELEGKIAAVPRN